MEHMVHSESEKYKSELHDALKLKFGSKLTEEDFDYITKSYDRYIFEMIKLMREGKSAHEKFFSDIILKSIDAIIGFNNEYEIFLWNEGAEKMFGWKKEEVVGKNFSVIVPRELLDDGEVQKMEKRINEQGFISNYETLRVTKTGDIKNVSISRYIIYNDKNENIGSVGIVRDITNEKKLEKELREKENLALIGQVVSSIAHNLSNPLNIISGNADYLLLDKKEGDADYDELKVIVAEATRITKSIRSILNFAKPLAPMRELASINSLLEESLSQFKFLKGQKDIDLKQNFQKEIPSVKIDKELFKDLFLNIIGNSIQAIPANKKGIIQVKTHSDENLAYIEITDNGVGIPESDIKNIFKPFFSTKGYGKGTGLGLAFTERVVKEHNGSIKVTSVPGENTVFLISIPLK